MARENREFGLVLQQRKRTRKRCLTRCLVIVNDLSARVVVFFGFPPTPHARARQTQSSDWFCTEGSGLARDVSFVLSTIVNDPSASSLSSSGFFSLQTHGCGRQRVRNHIGLGLDYQKERSGFLGPTAYPLPWPRSHPSCACLPSDRLTTPRATARTRGRGCDSRNGLTAAETGTSLSISHIIEARR